MTESSRPSAAMRLDQALARIRDPRLEGGKVFTALYEAAARREAEASDARIAAGKPLGLLDGRIVSPETLAEMTRPRFDVPAEHKRYGMGFWLGRRSSSLILEGYDAGASFRSTHDPTTRTTVTVLGNTSEGAWPVIFALADAMDGTTKGKFPDED